MLKKEINLDEQNITNNNIEREPTHKQEDFVVASTRDARIISNIDAMEILKLGSSGHPGVYQNSPYLFKTGTPKTDTSSRDYISGEPLIVATTTATLIEQQFEKAEKKELIKEVSSVVDKLMQKDDDFKIIKRQKLLNEMSDIFDNWTSEQMKSLSENENEIYNRMRKIVALEAMIESLADLPPEERW